MTGFYPDREIGRDYDKDLAQTPHDLEVYAHVEGLVGEETELLEKVEQDRKEEHRERLHAIRQELDRVWEMLHRRAERHPRSGS